MQVEPGSTISVYAVTILITVSSTRPPRFGPRFAEAVTVGSIGEAGDKGDAELSTPVEKQQM
jgi:hypothetical protein